MIPSRLRLPRRQYCFISRRTIADARPVAAGDVVVLRETKDRSAQPIFTRPLKPGRQTQSHRGIIRYDDIIGKRVRHVVTSKLSTKRNADGENKEPPPGTEYRVHEVKLAEYVRLTKRLVTPVYPADAALIVELLDLHPAELLRESVSDEQSTLEILEAGTGHGALTLYLSRAIHTANAQLLEPDLSNASEIQTYKHKRRAIIHTIEKKEKYSHHAQSVVSGFRRGLYASNVDFHVGDVSTWTTSMLHERGGTPFLSHAVLDLPGADAHLENVAAALRVDGTLIVFNPSLTQILTCCTKVREEGMLLELEKVIELPSGSGAAGREWDVRAVRPKKLKEEPLNVRSPVERSGETATENADSVDCKASHDSEDAASAPEESPGRAQDEEWHVVCRPKVGDRIVGGGFLGVFKKQRDRKGEINTEAET